MATREVEAMYILSFVSIKEVRNGYKGGGGHVCFVICQYKGGEEWLQGRWRHVCLVICQYKGGEEWLQERWRPCIFCHLSV